MSLVTFTLASIPLLFLVVESADAVLVFNSGEPPSVTSGGASLNSGRIPSDSFRLSQSSSLNEARVFLRIPEDSLDTLEISLFFFDGSPGLNSTQVTTRIAQVDSFQIHTPILSSPTNVYRLDLLFESVAISEPQLHWFGLATNVNGGFVLAESSGGADNILIGTPTTLAADLSDFRFFGGGDGSLAFSLSGTPIPEPSPLVLLAAGLSLGFCWRRRSA